MKQILVKRIQSVLVEINEQRLLQESALSVEDLPLSDRLLLAYLMRSRTELEALLHVENADAEPQDEPDTGEQDDDEFVSRLKALLKSNWDLVKCTPLSYTAMPDHFLTRFFCDIATQLACPEGLELETIGHQLIAQAQHPEPVLTNVTEVAEQRVYPIHLLMPGVQVVNINNGTLDVVGLTLHDAIHTHVESERAEYLIPILSLLNVGIDDNLEKIPNSYYHETHHSETQCFISLAEIARLSTHSAETSAICHAKLAYDELLKRDNCLLARLNELIKTLRYNSSHGGVGTNELAAEGAFTALTNFFEAYEFLLPAIRRLSDEDYWALNKLWHEIHTLRRYASAEIEYEKTEQGEVVLDEQGKPVPLMEAITRNGESVMVPKCNMTNLQLGSCIGLRKEKLIKAMNNHSDLLLRIKPSADERTQQLEKLKSNFVSAQDGLRVTIIQARYQGYAIHGMSKKVLDAFKVPFALSTNKELAYHQLKVLSDDELLELCQSVLVQRCIISTASDDEAFHQLMLAVSPGKVKVLLPIFLTRANLSSATLIMALDLIDFEKSIIFFKQLVNFRPDIVFKLYFLCGLCSNLSQKKFSLFLEMSQDRMSELVCTSLRPLDFLDEGSPVYFENLVKLCVMLITNSTCQRGSRSLLKIFGILTKQWIDRLADRLTGLWHHIKWAACNKANIKTFFSILNSEQVLLILGEVDGESLDFILSCELNLLERLSTEQLLSLYPVLKGRWGALLDPSTWCDSSLSSINSLIVKLTDEQFTSILTDIDQQLPRIVGRFDKATASTLTEKKAEALYMALRHRREEVDCYWSSPFLNVLYAKLPDELFTETLAGAADLDPERLARFVCAAIDCLTQKKAVLLCKALRNRWRDIYVYVHHRSIESIYYLLPDESFNEIASEARDWLLLLAGGANLGSRLFESFTQEKLITLCRALKGNWQDVFKAWKAETINAFYSRLPDDQLYEILSEVDDLFRLFIQHEVVISSNRLTREQFNCLSKSTKGQWRSVTQELSANVIARLFARLSDDQVIDIVAEVGGLLLNKLPYTNVPSRLKESKQLITLCRAFQGRWRATMQECSMRSLELLFCYFSDDTNRQIILELNGHFHEVLTGKDDFTFLSQHLSSEDFFALCHSLTVSTDFRWCPVILARALQTLSVEQKKELCVALNGRWADMVSSASLSRLNGVFDQLIDLPLQRQAIVDELSTDVRQYIKAVADVSFACRYFLAEADRLPFCQAHNQLFLADFYHAFDCIRQILSVMPPKDCLAFLQQFTGHWVKIFRQDCTRTTFFGYADFPGYSSINVSDVFQYVPSELVRSVLSEIIEGLAKHTLPFSLLVRLLPSLSIEDVEWLLTELFDYFAKKPVDSRAMIKLIKVMPCRFIAVFCDAMGKKFLSWLTFHQWHSNDWEGGVEQYKSFILALMTVDATYMPNPGEVKLLLEHLSNDERGLFCERLSARSLLMGIEHSALLDIFAVLTPEQIASIGPHFQGLFSKHKRELEDPVNASTLFKKRSPGESTLKGYYQCGYMAATFVSGKD